MTVVEIKESELIQLKRNLRRRRNELDRELEKIDYELQSLFVPENNFDGLLNR